MTAPPPQPFRKHRDPAAPGSIPERLQMFPREVRFYREVADSVGVRTPECYRAEVLPDGSTELELEDLSDWRAAPPPATVGRVLRRLHDRWRGTALARWPWLPRPDASDLVEALYARTWPALQSRADLPPDVRELGGRLLGRVAEAQATATAAGPPTLVHGDASAANMRADDRGEIALLDWEDYDWAPGVGDLAWHLVSSRGPEEWGEVVAAYGDDTGLDQALPAAAVQGLLSLAHCEEDSTDAHAWLTPLGAAARRLRDHA